MKELKVTDLKKTYGEKDLFDQISFLIHEKDRIGLIGTNGTGKTSLLNIIAGIDSGDGDRRFCTLGSSPFSPSSINASSYARTVWIKGLFP